MFILVFFKHKYYRKTVGVSRIRTWIVGIECKHPDHLTATKATNLQCLIRQFRPYFELAKKTVKMLLNAGSKHKKAGPKTPRHLLQLKH